jgi:hypothetical protein
MLRGWLGTTCFVGKVAPLGRCTCFPRNAWNYANSSFRDCAASLATKDCSSLEIALEDVSASLGR